MSMQPIILHNLYVLINKKALKINSLYLAQHRQIVIQIYTWIFIINEFVWYIFETFSLILVT
jgi:hypothetical protein